jgi:hypothetical protein
MLEVTLRIPEDVRSPIPFANGRMLAHPYRLSGKQETERMMDQKAHLRGTAR